MLFNHHQTQLMYIALILAGLVACNPERPGPDAVDGRRYTPEHVDLGRSLFSTHCANCHGASAEGTADWRKADANGNYPPPPLNGTAHAWHHPMPILEQTIAVGGDPFGGVMPGFAEMLSEDEARAVIAYFQSFWPDDIYARWQEIDNP